MRYMYTGSEREGGIGMMGSFFLLSSFAWSIYAVCMYVQVFIRSICTYITLSSARRQGEMYRQIHTYICT